MISVLVALCSEGYSLARCMWPVSLATGLKCSSAVRSVRVLLVCRCLILNSETVSVRFVTVKLIRLRATIALADMRGLVVLSDVSTVMKFSPNRLNANSVLLARCSVLLHRNRWTL